MSENLKRAGVFGGVLALVVIVGFAMAGIGGGAATTPAANDVSVDSFNSDSAVATTAPETGDLSMSADASGNVVVIDAGHGVSVDREALAPLASELTSQGATVTYFVGQRSGGTTLNESLRGADAFITFGAESRFTDRQLDGLAAFTDAGGRLLVLNEPQQVSSGSLFGYSDPGGDVPSPITPLVSQYGMTFGNGYLYDLQEYSVNYRNVYASPTGTSALTEGVDTLVFHEALAVDGGNTLVRTEKSTTLSRTREKGAYGVVAKTENVVVVGDSSIVGQEFLFRADNEVFVSNLLDFLVSGDKKPEDAPQEPEGGSSGPYGP